MNVPRPVATPPVNEQKTAQGREEAGLPAAIGDGPEDMEVGWGRIGTRSPVMVIRAASRQSANE